MLRLNKNNTKYNWFMKHRNKVHLRDNLDYTACGVYIHHHLNIKVATRFSEVNCNSCVKTARYKKWLKRRHNGTKRVSGQS